jgi:hypothetical protein
MEANQRTLLRIEKIFPLQLSVLYVASGMHTRRLDPDTRIADVSCSGDLNFTLALHFSKVPAISIEALTLNLTELSARLISNTGTCAWPAFENTANTKTHSATVLMPLSLRSSLA